MNCRRQTGQFQVDAIESSSLRSGLLFFLAVLVLFSLGADLRAQEPRRTDGCRPPTDEEKQWMKDNMIVTKTVRPNELAMKRLNGFRKAKGLDALPADMAIADEASCVDGKTQAQIEKEGMTLNEYLAPALTEAANPPLGDLPAVDNSLEDWFPPVGDQGTIGSCAAYSSTYYTMTSQIARLRGWKVSDGSESFSPRFTYNLVNTGQDAGTWLSTVYAMEQAHGAARTSVWPYIPSSSPSSNYLDWPQTANIWKDAINYRMGRSGMVFNIDTEAGLKTVKSLLLNGYILNYATDISGWQGFYKIKDDPSTTADDALVGQSCTTYCQYWGTGHGMTVVGFNDNLWCDVNENNVLDTGENLKSLFSSNHLKK